MRLSKSAREVIGELAERRGEATTTALMVAFGWGIGAFELQKRGAKATQWHERSPGTAVEIEPGVYEITLCEAAQVALAAVRRRYRLNREPFPSEQAAEIILDDVFEILAAVDEIANWWSCGNRPSAFSDGEWGLVRASARDRTGACRSHGR